MHISSVLDDKGIIQHDEGRINEAFLGYFKGIMGTDKILGRKTNMEVIMQGRTLTELQRETLMREVDATEIRKVLDDIEDSKSPGPDGFTAVFFNQSWKVVNNTVIDAIMAFLYRGANVKTINSTIIHLAAKCPNPSMPSEFDLLYAVM